MLKMPFQFSGLFKYIDNIIEHIFCEIFSGKKCRWSPPLRVYLRQGGGVQEGSWRSWGQEVIQVLVSWVTKQEVKQLLRILLTSEMITVRRCRIM
jgi:hypothetical protein